MNIEELKRLAEKRFSPRLGEHRLAFPRAVQAVLGEASNRGMTRSSPTYGAVEELAQNEIEQRGRMMLEGYRQALTASSGPIPQSFVAEIKQDLEAALHRECREVEAKIQYVRNAIKPARTKNAAELMAPTLAKVIADLDLLCTTLNSSRASATRSKRWGMPGWIRRHALLAAFLTFAFGAAPQWIASIWSLFSSEPLVSWLARHNILQLPFSPFWITGGISSFLLAAICWLVWTRKDQPKRTG